MENQNNNDFPIIMGEYANWANVNSNDLQTTIDFGFIQSSEKDKPIKCAIIRRMILPPTIAKELGQILLNTVKNYDESKKSEKKDN